MPQLNLVGERTTPISTVDWQRQGLRTEAILPADVYALLGRKPCHLLL